MSFAPQEPVDAIILPDNYQPPRRRGRGVLLFGCLIASILLIVLVAAVGYSINRLVNASNRQAAEWLSAAERQAALVAAFDGQRRKIEDASLIEAQQLLDRVATTSRERDDAAFRELIDFNRLVKRITTYPGQGRISGLEIAVLKFQLQQDIDGVGAVQRFEIAALDHPDPEHTVVFAYAFNEEVRGDPYRFIFCRTDQGLMLEDWERVETGWTKAAQYARVYIEAEDPLIDSYGDLWDELGAIDELIEEYEYEQAKQRLRALERNSVPRLLADLSHARVALIWLNLGEDAQCLQANRRVQKPDEMPGVYAVGAIAHFNLDQYEQVLVAADNYARVAGFQVEIVETRAQALTTLGRTEEALADWRRLAEFLPDDAEILASYCDALPPQDRRKIIGILSRSEAPAFVASDLVNALISRDDETTLRILQDFISQRSLGEPTSSRLNGRIYAYLGQYELAADCYRAAAELANDRDEAVDDWQLYLEAMVEEDRIVEGYRNVPDANMALRSLADDIDGYGGLIIFEQLPDLLEAHRQREPNDPWLHYFTGLLDEDRNDLEVAERKFSLAAASHDEDLTYLAAAKHRQTLVRAGQLEAAYLAYPDEFYDLASTCEQQRDAEGIAVLLELRRVSHPEEGQLHYYTALLDQWAGRYESALERLATISDDEADIDSVEGLENALLVALGRWRDAYETSTSPEDVFYELADDLQQRRDVIALQALCELHRTRCADDPAWLVRTADLAMVQRDFDRLIQILTPWPAELLESSYSEEILREQLVVSFLRTGRESDARQWAEKHAETDDDYTPLLFVLDRQRDWQRLEELLENPDALEDLQDQLEYGETNTLLAYRSDPQAADLRHKYPMTLPMQDFYGSVTVLLARPATLNAEKLDDLLSDDPDARIRSLPVAHAETENAWEIRVPAGRIVVGAGPGKYSDQFVTPRFQQRFPELATILLEHDGWLVVEGVEATYPYDFSLDSVVRDLTARLLDESSLAVCVSAAMYGDSRLAVMNDSTAAALRSSQAIDLAFPDATVERWYKAESDDLQSPAYAGGLRRKQLREFGQTTVAASQIVQGSDLAPSGPRAPNADSKNNHQVAVRLDLGPASEILWLDVIEARHTGYGNYEWTGEVLENSQLWPWLKSGERVSCGWYDVVDWREE